MTFCTRAKWNCTMSIDFVSFCFSVIEWICCSCVCVCVCVFCPNLCPVNITKKMNKMKEQVYLVRWIHWVLKLKPFHTRFTAFSWRPSFASTHVCVCMCLENMKYHQGEYMNMCNLRKTLAILAYNKYMPSSCHKAAFPHIWFEIPGSKILSRLIIISNLYFWGCLTSRHG